MITGLGGVCFYSGPLRISSRLRSRCGGSRGLGSRSRRRRHSRRRSGSRRLFVEHHDGHDFTVLADTEFVHGIVDFVALRGIEFLIIVLAKLKRKLADALRVRAAFFDNIALDIVDPETSIGQQMLIVSVSLGDHKLARNPKVFHIERKLLPILCDFKGQRRIIEHIAFRGNILSNAVLTDPQSTKGHRTVLASLAFKQFFAISIEELETSADQLFAGCLIRLVDCDRTLHRYIHKADARLIFNLHNLVMIANGYGVHVFIAEEPDRCFVLSDEVIPIGNIIHAVNAGIDLRDEADEFIVRLIKRAVSIRICIQIELSTGHMVFGVICIDLSKLNASHDRIVDDLQTDNLSVICERNVVAGIRQHIGFRGCDLYDHVITERNLLKGKLALVIRYCGQDCRFIAEIFRFFREQAKNGVLKGIVILIDFDPFHTAKQQFIDDPLATIEANTLLCRHLIGVLERQGIHILVLLVMRRSRQLLRVVLAKGEIRSEYDMAFLVCECNLNQPVSRNHAAIQGGNILRGVKAKRNRSYFSIETNTETVACLHRFIGINCGLLTVIHKGSVCSRDRNLLTRIRESDLHHFGVDRIPKRSCRLDNQVFAKIEFIRRSSSVFTGRDFSDNIPGCTSQSAITRVDIFRSNHSIGRTRQRLDLIDRGIDLIDKNCRSPVLVARNRITGHIDRREYFTTLGNVDLTFLRHVVYSHRDHIQIAFRLVAPIGHSKGHRRIIQDITVRRLDFDQRIVASREIFRGQQTAVIRDIERVDLGQGRIGVLHDNFVAGCIVDLEPSTTQWNRLTRLSISFDDLQKCREVGVVNEELINLSVLCDEDRKIGHHFSFRISSSLMHGILAVRQFL